MTRQRGTVIHRDAWVGPRAVLEEPVHVSANAHVYNGTKLGRYSFINVGSVIYSSAEVGRFVMMGRWVEVGAAVHPVSWLSTHLFQATHDTFPHDEAYVALKRRKIPLKLHPPTKIGNDCWIGAKAVIKAGVTVGDGAVIGAGSVVTRDIPPYAVAVGSPARVKRLRFDERTVARLLELRWWNLPLRALDDIPFDDVTQSLDILEQRAADLRASSDARLGPDAPRVTQQGET